MAEQSTVYLKDGGLSAIWKIAVLIFGILSIVSLCIGIYAIHMALGMKSLSYQKVDWDIRKYI